MFTVVQYRFYIGFSSFYPFPRRGPTSTYLPAARSKVGAAMVAVGGLLLRSIDRDLWGLAVCLYVRLRHTEGSGKGSRRWKENGHSRIYMTILYSRVLPLHWRGDTMSRITVSVNLSFGAGDTLLRHDLRT